MTAGLSIKVIFPPAILLVQVSVGFYLAAGCGPSQPDAPESESQSRAADSFGEMAGVAGLRLPQDPCPAEGKTAGRLDLEQAAGVAGLRRLEDWCRRLAGKIESGETMSVALVRAGLASAAAAEIAAALRGFIDFRRLRPGQAFQILVASSGRVERFLLRQSPLVRMEAARRGERLEGRRIETRPEVLLSEVSFSIEDSLFGACERAGEAALALEIADLFAWDIDFYLDPRSGDRVTLLIEKLYAGGEFAGYGKIMAAQYQGSATGLRRAFFFRRRDGREGYYDEEGGSLRKAFLKSPLKFTRISSGFGRRVHPILGFSHLHAAVDLAAPPGTPILAPADGLVLFSGWQGAAGRMVKLRHANGYQTVYAHLKSISTEVRTGARVRQKQVIGTVGSSGRSTGPHLHYAMKKNGVSVNPFSQRFPPAEPVPTAEREQFQRVIAPLVKRLAPAEASAAERPAKATAGEPGQG